MGFLAAAIADRGTKSANVYERWLELIGTLGGKSKSGPYITLQQAFRVSAALSCLRVIGNGCAQVPFKLFQSKTVGGLEKIQPAREHKLYDRLTVKPNGWQTSFEFREQLALHAAMGNAYAFKNIFRGELLELILLDPMCVKAEQRDDYSIVYRVHGRNGQLLELPADQVWHVRGMSWDGFLGIDTLKIAREALGLSVAAEETHAALHANGMHASGVYTVDGTLAPDQHTKVVNWLKKYANGGEYAGLPLVLDRNAKWISQTQSGLDSEHMKLRDHEITEVCRFFGVLPIMIGHTGDKASTYASAEQMFLAHKVHTLDAWYSRIEQSADANLLTEKDRKAGYYFKFIAAGMLRGSQKERSDYFAKALGSGGAPAWMTQDEVRALEELNPMGGEAAKLPARLAAQTQPPADPNAAT